jgi:hypothetical protein
MGLRLWASIRVMRYLHKHLRQFAYSAGGNGPPFELFDEDVDQMLAMPTAICRDSRLLWGRYLTLLITIGPPHDMSHSDNVFAVVGISERGPDNVDLRGTKCHLGYRTET